MVNATTRKTAKVVAGALLLLVATGLAVEASAHVRTHLWIGLGPWWGPWYHPVPYPVYVHPVPLPVPAPCRSVWVEGHWERRPMRDERGFITYRDVWIPGYWERLCP